MESKSVREKLLNLNKSWLHPELAIYIEGIASLVDKLESIDYNVPELESLKEIELNALDWFYSLPTYANGIALSFPLVNPEICDYLVNYIKDKDFIPNSEEEKDYQIPEYVLSSKDPELFNTISNFAQVSLFLIYNLFWGKYPNTVESIQLAKYSPTGIKKTQWHHDADSTMTGLINLAPELYKGGGTDIRTSLLTYEYIAPIPKGHALIFNGNMVLHRGCEVTEGERYLLVFWTTTDRNKTL